MRSLGIAVLCGCDLLLAGCGGEPKAGMTKTEAQQFRAPLGQPMPEEARRAMQQSEAKRRGAEGQPPAPK